jgi:hypothetical protein
MSGSVIRKSGSLQGRFVKDVGKLAMRGTLTSFSSTPEEARKRVLTLYKACQIAVPIVLEVYFIIYLILILIDLCVFRIMNII